MAINQHQIPMLDACPLGCQPTLDTSSFALSEGMLRRCTQCGQMISSCTQDMYDQSMQEFNQPEGTTLSGHHLTRQKQRIGRILMKGARYLSSIDRISMLDVGCSSGSVLKVADTMGFHVQGIEPAAKAAATARSLGFEVTTGFLQEAAFPDHCFDMVTIFEVIEHVMEPVPLMQEIHRILRPGGICVMGTGNTDSWTVRLQGARWEYFDISRHGGHISFFHPKSVALLAKHSGFDLLQLTTKRISIIERNDTTPWMYGLSIIAREVLELPARLFHKGHDMLAIMRA